jgi:excisionase family DNA binding protein
LGVTPKTIRNAILRGELAASLTPGGHHRIRREEVGRYMTDIEKIVENSEESEKSEKSNETPRGDTSL